MTKNPFVIDFGQHTGSRLTFEKDYDSVATVQKKVHMTVITSQSRTAQHTKNTKKRHTNGLKYVRKRYIGPKICRKKNSTYCNFRQSYSFVGIDTVTRRERCTLVENMHINICAKQNTLHLCACLCHCACVEHKYRTCMNLNTNNVNKRHVRLCAVVLAFQGIASNNEKNEKKKQQYAPCSKKAFLRTPVRRVRTTRACCILTVGLEASIGTTQSHENNFGFGNEKKKKTISQAPQTYSQTCTHDVNGILCTSISTFIRILPNSRVHGKFCCVSARHGHNHTALTSY